MFSNTFAGIAPSSVPGFIAAQIVGGVVAIGLIRLLYPGVTPAEAADIVVPHLHRPETTPKVSPTPTRSTSTVTPPHS